MTPQPSRGPELRIGDDEREAAVNALGEHFAAGRLTKEEYDERTEQAWAARTRSALMPLFADLPRPQATGPTPQAAQPIGPPRGPTSRPRRGQWWLGARMAPVLLVVVALVVLTNLPVFLLLILGWFLWIRSARHTGGCGQYGRQPGGQARRDWVR